MFGKEKPSDLQQIDWAKRFDADRLATDELAVARLLHDSRLQPAYMPADARQTLRRRLIAQHNRRFYLFDHALRYAMITATVAVVAGLL